MTWYFSDMCCSMQWAEIPSLAAGPTEVPERGFIQRIYSYTVLGPKRTLDDGVRYESSSFRDKQCQEEEF
jgi:hypothetical protein